MGQRVVDLRSQESIEQRLVEINQIRDGLDQVKTLVELASELLPSRSRILGEAMTAASKIENRMFSLQAIGEIIPQLPAAELPFVKETLSNIDREFCLEALTLLLSHDAQQRLNP